MIIGKGSSVIQLMRATKKTLPTASPGAYVEPRLQRSAYRHLALLVAAALILLSSVRPAASATDAMATVKETVNQALAILKDPHYEEHRAENRAKLRQMLEPRFDFKAMARSSLGVHWRKLTPAQREEFSQLFQKLLEASYMGKIESYHGETVKFLREIPEGQGYAQVNTDILQPGKDPIHVNYRLKRVDGTWKIYDVLIDGISLSSNYRTQFNRVINKKGYDELVKLIRQKEQQLNQTPGTS